MGVSLELLLALLGSSLLAVSTSPQVRAANDGNRGRRTMIRAGQGRTIVATKGKAKSLAGEAPLAGEEPGAVAGQFPHPPRPRLAGFSPLVAITASNKRRSTVDFDFSHELHDRYVGTALNPPADVNYVIGFLDSGADVDLAAGGYADTLGLRGTYLTANTIPIGGVGGFVNALISQPVGIFAAGLSAIRPNATLDLSAVVGHSNVASVVAPSIDCGNGEVVTALLGMPFLSFYNTVIRVDTPRTVNTAGGTFTSPDVQLLDPMDDLPTFAHQMSMVFGGLVPATTAAYFPNLFDPEDQETPITPTLLSYDAASFPTGGSFFALIQVLQGVPSPTNTVQSMWMLVDTGAQVSVMTPVMAAALSLPLEPDFTVTVCGVGGPAEDTPGYYVDYVKMNAYGGAMEFSRAPFVMLDLPALPTPGGNPLGGLLGMNFFWNRNVIFEPSLTAAFLQVSNPIPFAFADSNADFDVDGDDAEAFLKCVTDPRPQSLLPECDHLDSDENGTIDLLDFARFQVCYSGSGAIADPSCGE